jgi:glyoxylase-like metal-dependent hydrolase (beta-lactamase superfamily II)
MAGPSYNVGSLRLTVVSDGTAWLDAGAVFGLIPKLMWSRVTGETNERNQVPLALNCVLLESDGKTVLIETGQGNKDFETLRKRGDEPHHGQLLESLAASGVRPDDIDIVINTHLHADHCGWNTCMEGETLRPTFPNARYYIQRGEWEQAQQPNERTRATYLAENLDAVFATGQIEFVEGELQITPDITMIETPGHTADHASIVIANGGETALYLGDVVQHEVQLERVAWISAFDILPLVSLETKKRLVHEAITTGQLVVCVHSTFPGVGRLISVDGRTKFDPEAPHG